VPVLRAPLPTSALSVPGPVAVARSGEHHHAQPAREFFIPASASRVRHDRVRRRRPAAAGRAAGGGSDRMRCAPARLVGGRGRRGRSCDTPPPRFLIPASPRYFRLPGRLSAPYKKATPAASPAAHSTHIGPGDFACSLSRGARPTPVSLRAGEPPRATCVPCPAGGFLAFDGHLFASHGYPPAKRPRVVPGAPPLARRPSAAASSTDPRAAQLIAAPLPQTPISNSSPASPVLGAAFSSLPPPVCSL